MAPRPQEAVAVESEFVASEVPAAKPSLRARLLAVFLRLFVRPLLLRATDLVLLRERLRWFDHLLPSHGPATRLARIADLDAEVFAAAAPKRVLLYLHGGGFCFRSTRAHSAFLRNLSRELDAVGVLPKYRLSPEFPFPAALEDCARAYEAIIVCGVQPASIVIAGDSAGGNLALALLMRLRDARAPLPACAVLISPGTDLAAIGERESHAMFGSRDPLVPPEALPRIVAAYAGDHDPADARISPLRGDFRKLPPLHFVASAHETLRDDASIAAAHARAAGVIVELCLHPEMVHAFPLFQALPEARAARAAIVTFVEAHAEEHVAGATRLLAQLH